MDKLSSKGKNSLKETGIYPNVDKDSNGAKFKDLIKEIKEIIDEGSIKAVIDRRYPLE